MSLVPLFCDVDDFCQKYEIWIANQQLGQYRAPGPKGRLALSEIMTIVIYFHQSNYRNFKSYYQKHVCKQLRSEFPKLVSYNRFIELMPRTILPLYIYLRKQFGQVTGISFIDSTPLKVCHNKRINRHRTFAELANRGKHSMGWFYGFKLHLVVNERGELLACQLTSGNVDDRKPVPKLSERLFGKLFGDKGYISKALFTQLWDGDVQLITNIRTNMANKLLPIVDKCLLRKRFIIETINDQLKNISQIEHSRHRSFNNFVVNLLSGLIAYTHQPKKPSLNLTEQALLSLPPVC